MYILKRKLYYYISKYFVRNRGTRYVYSTCFPLRSRLYFLQDTYNGKGDIRSQTSFFLFATNLHSKSACLIKNPNKIQSSYIYERCSICKVLYVAQCNDPLHDYFYRKMILLNIFIQLLSNGINTGLYFH